MEAKLQRRIQRYGWDRAVPVYERAWKRQLEPAQNRMLALSAMRLGSRVLDVACGTGLVTFRAAEIVGATGYVTGVDISGQMIESARRRAAEFGISHVAFERSDAEELPFANATFDVAFCGLGLMYVPDPARAAMEIYRVLKPGGFVAAAVWGRRDRCGWAAIFSIVDARVRTEVCPLFFQLGIGDSLVTTFKRAGFAGMQSERLETRLDYGSPDDALSAAFAGGPVALAYSHFDALTRDQVHAEYLESIASFRNASGGYEIPGEFVVASGRKPSRQAANL